MLAIIQTHLELKGERSPFALLASSMMDTIAHETARHASMLADQVKANFEDTWKWLEGMFGKEGYGEEDQADVAEKVQKYVIKARGEVDFVNALITRIEDKGHEARED